MKKLKFIIIAIVFCAVSGISPSAAKEPRKAKFYDFDDQLINGEIKKPTTLYTDAREKVKFERLLRLKKSFMNDLFDTAKERVFK